MQARENLAKPTDRGYKSHFKH